MSWVVIKRVTMVTARFRELRCQLFWVGIKLRTTVFLRVRIRPMIKIYSFAVNSSLGWESNSGLLFFLGLELGLETLIFFDY